MKTEPKIYYVKNSCVSGFVSGYSSSEGTLGTSVPISYELDGGTLASASPTTFIAGTSLSLNAPTKSGYTFAWWESTEYGDQFESAYTPCDEELFKGVKLKAIWKKSDDPTGPTQPSDPVQPSDPTDPTNPSQPSEPYNPSNPSDPVDPTNPGGMYDPNDPSLINIADLNPQLMWDSDVYAFGLFVTIPVTIEGLVEGEDFGVLYYNNISAGTATATVYGRHSFDETCPYVGSVDLEYKIEPMDIAAAEPRLTKTKLAYTGERANPKVVFDFMDLVENVDYRLTCKSKNIGKAKVTIKGIGDYGSSTVLNFTIVPAKAAFKSVKPASKKVALKVKAQKGGVKYQVAYRLGKGKWVTKNLSKTSLTVKKLKSKKKYSFRVRAYKKVKGKTYYGAWSKTKTVTVK